MIKQQHTPGPWHYDLMFIVAPDPYGRHPDIYIAEIAEEDEEGRIATITQRLANRQLIASAPNLLGEAISSVEQIENLLASDDARIDSDTGACLAAISAALTSAITNATKVGSY